MTGSPTQKAQLGERISIHELISIGGPIALQSFFLNGLNLVDNLMVGQLGAPALGAVNLGNQLYFINMLLGFGIASGTTVFTSRFWGRNDRYNIRRAFRMGGITLLGGSLLFSGISLLIPRLFLSWYSTDLGVINLGAGYLQIVGWSYPLIGASNLLAGILRSTRDVHTPLIASSTALCLNTLGNFILIYGLGPIPAFGIAGAAMATLGSRVIELMLILILGFSRPGGILRDLFRHPSPSPGTRTLTPQEYFSKTVPVIGNEILWSIGYTMYALVFGRMGTESLAAYSILETVVKLSLVLFIGSANGGAIIIGNTLGKGEDAKAQSWAQGLLFWVPIASLVFSGVIVLLGAIIPLGFNVGEDSRQIASGLLIIYALVLPFKILNLHAIVSILRSGGDTVYSLWVDAGTLWLLGVPLALALGLWLGVPGPLVYLGPLVEEVAKAVILVQRTWSGRWRNHRV